jgi:serine protease AprX
MDTGVCEHPDLRGRILKFRDFTENRDEIYDDNGHGTHVCGIIGGNRTGMAPECTIIALKVMDHTGNGSVEHSMNACRWILENRERYNIRVVNISMGMEPKQNPDGERYILKAVELLWDMGIVVVAAAGNLGPDAGSITIPGIHKKIITVGAYDNLKSGRGSEEKNIIKPDLVAPGSKIFSCNADWKQKGNQLYVAKSGTSMSTPIVAGAIAQMLSKYPNMPNTEVKRILMNCCDDLHLPKIRQGSGLLNVQKLLQ